jgi:hypothetical protein
LLTFVDYNVVDFVCFVVVISSGIHCQKH